LENIYTFKIFVEIFSKYKSYPYFYSTEPVAVFDHCGVMKFLADMPPCLGGGDNRINVA
jgi:hypothetical protein